MPKITLTNCLHGTTITVRPRAGVLNKSQVRKARQTLCGKVGCHCGGALGQLGPGNPEVDYNRITGCATIIPDEV